MPCRTFLANDVLEYLHEKNPHGRSLARIDTVNYNAIWKTGFFVVGNFIEMHVFVKFVKHYLVVALLGFFDLLCGGGGPSLGAVSACRLSGLIQEVGCGNTWS